MFERGRPEQTGQPSEQHPVLRIGHDDLDQRGPVRPALQNRLDPREARHGRVPILPREGRRVRVHRRALTVRHQRGHARRVHLREPAHQHVVARVRQRRRVPQRLHIANDPDGRRQQHAVARAEVMRLDRFDSL